MRAAEGAAVLQADGLYKVHGEKRGLVRAVDGVDLDVPAGQMLAVTGPSGCGKSTLLHLLGGLDRPTAGEVRLCGERIDTLPERALAKVRRRAVGFVFQAFHLVDELSAQQNVELPRPGPSSAVGRWSSSPTSRIAAVVGCLVAAVCLVSAVPALISTRRPVTAALTTETTT